MECWHPTAESNQKILQSGPPNDRLDLRLDLDVISLARVCSGLIACTRYHLHLKNIEFDPYLWAATAVVSKESSLYQFGEKNFGNGWGLHSGWSGDRNQNEKGNTEDFTFVVGYSLCSDTLVSLNFFLFCCFQREENCHLKTKTKYFAPTAFVSICFAVIAFSPTFGRFQ